MKNELLEKIKIEICHFPKTLVAVLEHHGDERLINQSIAQFIAWRKQTAESPITQSETFGLAYNDPEMTPKDEYRFDICGSVKNPVKANNYGIITKTIPAGRCAKITHHGPYQSMGDKIRYLYAHWIIEKDIELRNFPCFFQYRNLFPQVQENQLVTDIYLPIW